MLYQGSVVLSIVESSSFSTQIAGSKTATSVFWTWKIVLFVISVTGLILLIFRARTKPANLQTKMDYFGGKQKLLPPSIVKKSAGTAPVVPWRESKSLEEI